MFEKIIRSPFQREIGRKDIEEQRQRLKRILTSRPDIDWKTIGVKEFRKIVFNLPFFKGVGYTLLSNFGSRRIGEKNLAALINFALGKETRPEGREEYGCLIDFDDPEDLRNVLNSVENWEKMNLSQFLQMKFKTELLTATGQYILRQFAFGQRNKENLETLKRFVCGKMSIQETLLTRIRTVLNQIIKEVEGEQEKEIGTAIKRIEEIYQTSKTANISLTVFRELRDLLWEIAKRIKIDKLVEDKIHEARELYSQYQREEIKEDELRRRLKKMGIELVRTADKKIIYGPRGRVKLIALAREVGGIIAQKEDDYGY